MNKVNQYMHFNTIHTCNTKHLLPTCILLAIVALTGTILSSSTTIAESSSADASVTVPEACTMTGSGMNSHTATLTPGTYSGASGSEYQNGIGKTTFTVICNDYNGFAIYAIGYTGNEYSGENHTKLIGTSSGVAISTKVYASGDTTSNWSMKVNKVTDSAQSYLPANMSIQNSFDSWHVIPDTYTKVAQYKASTGSSVTDTTLGAKIDTTYAAFIAPNQPGDTYVGQVKYTMVHPYNETPLQPQTCPSNKICYFANGSNVEGTMGQQAISTPSQNSIMLLASNFSREGYGFAGWSDAFDYATNPEAHFYGPQEGITFTAGQYSGSNPGLSLYAVWVKSAGSLQDSSKVSLLCGTGTGSLVAAPTDGTANLSSVSALTDLRDNETYAIAKLADGKCWMMENFRLESTNSDNSTGALAQGYGTSAAYGNFSGLANAESTGFSNTYSANSLYSNDGSNGTINIGSNVSGKRMPRYNNTNTPASTLNRPQNPTTNDATNSSTNASMYSYGNYYTWRAAVADTDYNPNIGERSTTSICPKGWKLPKGGQSTADNSFGALSVALGGPADGATADSSTSPNGATVAHKFRSYPNNFLYSGYYSNSSIYSKGVYGYYWTSYTGTGLGGDEGGYHLYLYSSIVRPGNYSSSGSMGQSVRCTASTST